MSFTVPSFLKSVKYTLGAVNILFLLTGMLFLITGIVTFLINLQYEDLITRKFFAVPSFVMATGVIIVLTSVLGFYGALSKEFYFIAGYVILLLVVLVFEISMVIVAYGMEDNATTDIKSTMLQTLNQYQDKMAYAKLWDELQMEFECCGVGGRYDWVSNALPVSCCHIDYGVIGTFICLTENAYTQGCATVLGELLSYNAHVVAVTALVGTCLQCTSDCDHQLERKDGTDDGFTWPSNYVPITAVAAWIAWRCKYEEVTFE